jgi:hypothetical protein
MKMYAMIEVSICHWGPKAVLFRLAQFLLEVLAVDREFDSRSDQIKDYKIIFVAYLISQYC